MTRMVSFIVLLLVLVGCGAPKPSAQAVAQEVMTALAAGDTLTLTELLEGMPNKDYEIATDTRFWRRQLARYGAITQTEVHEPQERGKSTAVTLVNTHERGTSTVTFLMQNTDAGWRVVDWEEQTFAEKEDA
jgi:hypothetical protein